MPEEIPPVEAVDGIGPVYEQRLREHGVANVKALAGLGAAESAEILDISEDQAQGLIDQASELAGDKE